MNRQHSRLLVIGLILSALFVGALLGARYFATQELKNRLNVRLAHAARSRKSLSVSSRLK